ncbi:helix-turn-helix transcriptional regulator [Bacillus cereus]
MNNTFGKKVKTWLVINEMKQKDLADMLNISSAYLSDILLNKRKGDKVRQKIIKILETKEVS